MSAAEPLPVDPFCSTADPARYVPRAATERALAELRDALAEGPGKLIAFTGPVGIGKSLLLSVLAAERSPLYTFVCLQATPPSAEQVCESALHALGDAVPPDPVGALGLRAALLARRGRPLVLLLDSVEALSPEAIADLATLPLESLRTVLVASERDEHDDALEVLGPDLPRVRLAAALSRAETEEYLRARLEAADASPELRVKLLATALDLWRRSRGNPQCLHAEISEVQFELWRAGEAEPRLRMLLPEPEVAATVPMPDEPSPEPLSEPIPELAALEVGTELEPASAAEIEPPAIAPAEITLSAIEPAEIALEEIFEVERPATRRASTRTVMFAFGALSGAVATAAVMFALGSLRLPSSEPPSPAAVSAPPPVALVPQVEPAVPPPVAAAPPVEPPAPAVVEPVPTPPAAKVRPKVEVKPPAPARAPPRKPVEPVRVHVQALPWATIYVDGVLAGETPLGDLPVKPGLREFRAEMPDGRKLVKRVQVRAGTRVLFQ